jgi:hypothetical protein
MRNVQAISILTCLSLSGGGALAAGKARPADSDQPKAAEAVAAARAKALKWLTQHQAKDGSWGKTYTVAITSFAVLGYLSAGDEPFAGADRKALVGGLKFLMGAQKDGVFPGQGHSWIHGQGFATLALSEAAGRAMLCKTKPDLDLKKMRAIVAKAVAVIADNQSRSGGWWYTRGAKGNHEGSTTVCAVQALVSAANYGIPIKKEALDRGFEYLKKCQNRDGGFDYQLDNSPNTTSMKEGTAAGVATLGLMKKFDYAVMMKGYQFLLKIGPETISRERFPYYGHFYGCMGMRLLGQEFSSFRPKTSGYIAAAQKAVVSWQDKEGASPVKGWMRGNDTSAYATAFAALILAADEGRLSILNRTPPKLPPAAAAPQDEEQT